MGQCCDTAELLIAALIGLGLLSTLAAYVLTELQLCAMLPGTDRFLGFLGDMFSLVVGIEFVKMLLKPSAENVISELAFLVARHLIIGESTALGILICVLCVILLYGFQVWVIKKRQDTRQ